MSYCLATPHHLYSRLLVFGSFKTNIEEAQYNELSSNYYSALIITEYRIPFVCLFFYIRKLAHSHSQRTASSTTRPALLLLQLINAFQ